MTGGGRVWWVRSSFHRRDEVEEKEEERRECVSTGRRKYENSNLHFSFISLRMSLSWMA